MEQPLADIPESWPVDGSSDLHRDQWVVALREDRVRRPGQSDPESFRRIVLEHPGAAVVLAVDEADRVCCLVQYRHAVGHRLVELPAGLCDEPGEAPEAVARRELREEAGLEAGSWTRLTSAYSSPGISSELIHFFVARELTPVGRGDFAPRHEEAEMDVVWVALSDLRAAVLDGRVRDAPLVLAVLLAAARGLAPRQGAGE